jgi:hypothetical protein
VPHHVKYVPGIIVFDALADKLHQFWRRFTRVFRLYLNCFNAALGFTLNQLGLMDGQNSFQIPHHAYVLNVRVCLNIHFVAFERINGQRYGVLQLIALLLKPKVSAEVNRMIVFQTVVYYS